MKRVILGVGVVLMGLLLVAGLVSAEIPHLINFQGRLTDASGLPVPDGTPIKFSIYNVSGAALWSETHPSDSDSNGIFDVLLGSVDPINNPLDLPFDQNYWLGIKVGTDLEMTPRQRITSVGYAFSADNALKLNSQEASYYLNASNINAGALADTRIPDAIARDSEITYKTESDLTTALDDNYVNEMQADSISGSMIDDGTIINADISSLAAIAGTKISPDFGSQNVVTTGHFKGDGSQLINLPADNDWTISGDNVYRTTGNVGIGTTSPSNMLDIYGIASSVNFHNQQLKIYDTRPVAANIGPGINLGGTYTGSTVTEWAYIGSGKENTIDGDYSGYLRFGTRANGSSIAEHMRITSNGNVGIGTTNPDKKLRVVEKGFDVFGIENTVAGGSAWNFNVGDDGLGLANTLVIGYKGVYGGGIGGGNTYPVMSLKTDGNVGIGTTAPKKPLHVKGGVNPIAVEGYADHASASATLDTMPNNSFLIGGASGSTFFIYWKNESGVKHCVTLTGDAF